MRTSHNFVLVFMLIISVYYGRENGSLVWINTQTDCALLLWAASYFCCHPEIITKYLCLTNDFFPLAKGQLCLSYRISKGPCRVDRCHSSSQWFRLQPPDRRGKNKSEEDPCAGGERLKRKARSDRTHARSCRLRMDSWSYCSSGNLYSSPLEI